MELDDLARTLLEADAVGHDQMAGMLEETGDPLLMAPAHRRASALIREALEEPDLLEPGSGS